MTTRIRTARTTLLAVAAISLAGCIPPVPLGDLGGGPSAAPPAITITPHIYVSGAALTVGAGADTSGSDGGVEPTPPRSTPASVGDAPRRRMPTVRAAPEPGLAPDGLAATLREAEGYSPTVYRDTGGVPHIGYGHRLTPAEADALLAADIAEARAAAERVVGEATWRGLDEARRDVLVEMAYMLGASGLARFRLMLDAVRRGDFDAAADELAASLLYDQVPTRTVRLAATLRGG